MMGTHHRGTEKEIRALEAFIALSRATNSVFARLSKTKAFGELTPSQFGVLEALYHLGPLSQRQLSDKLLRSTGNLVTVIDNLQGRGLVQRSRSTRDRRVVIVSLTDKGRARIAALFPTHVSALIDAFAVLSGQEQEDLKRLCRTLGVGQRREEDRS